MDILQGARDMDDGSWRRSYVNNALDRARVEKVLTRRERLLVEIGGTVNYEGILEAAVKRCRAAARAEGRSDDLYGTWHQHNGTKSNVFDRFREILNDPDLAVSQSQKVLLLNQLDNEWGTGASLYFA